MLSKKELMIIGFFIGLVIVLAVLFFSAKNFFVSEKSLEAPVSTFNFFDPASRALAKDIFITAFDSDGNIVPLNLDTFLYTQIQKTQNALMDQVNATLDNYVKKRTSVHLSVDGVGQLQTDGSKWMKATAGGDGQTITLF
jgi:hypothetical protein